MDSIAADGAAAALYVSNIRFAAQATDYLQADLAPSPLLHYWSLGVEEQFYLFWPALLAILAVVVRRPAAIAIAIVCAGVASFAFSLWLTADNAPLAFFLLPSRAWELAVGGMIAVAGSRIRLGPPAVQMLGVAGLVAVVTSGVVLTSDMAFPGIVAVLPVAGAAMLLLAASGATPSVASRALSIRPMRYVGRISYSLYLWHCPLLVIPAAAIGSQLGTPAVVALVALTFVLSDASQRYIEEPIRADRALKSLREASLAMAGAASLVVALTALTLFRGPSLDGLAAASASLPPLDLPGEPSPTSTDPGASAEATESIRPNTTAGGPVPEPLRSRLQIEQSMLPRIFRDRCQDRAHGCRRRQLRVWRSDVARDGVSHRRLARGQWFPSLESIAQTHRWRLVSLTKRSCPVAAIGSGAQASSGSRPSATSGAPRSSIESRRSTPPSSSCRTHASSN
jgi:peptidoglycan/LPS O-acetylase OafA/YrhL